MVVVLECLVGLALFVWCLVVVCVLWLAWCRYVGLVARCLFGQLLLAGLRCLRSVRFSWCGGLVIVGCFAGLSGYLYCVLVVMFRIDLFWCGYVVVWGLLCFVSCLDNVVFGWVVGCTV